MFADDAAMVAMAPGDRPAECFVLLSDQVSDVAGGAGRTVADAEGRSAPGESAGVVVARSPNPLCKQGVSACCLADAGVRDMRGMTLRSLDQQDTNSAGQRSRPRVANSGLENRRRKAVRSGATSR
jgi:hypothetical protein